jgi:hypothetical protein
LIGLSPPTGSDPFPASDLSAAFSSSWRNRRHSLRITWWQRGEEEFTGAREEMVDRVARIWERHSEACGERGELRRQMQGIKAA